MKNIKIRAWDKKLNKYIYKGLDLALEEINSEEPVNKENPIGFFPDIFKQRFVYELYTEVLDKNLKEICVNDIVDINISGIIYRGIIEYKFGVFIINNLYELETKKPFGLFLDNSIALNSQRLYTIRTESDLFNTPKNLDKLEIIGNINENKNLIWQE